LSFVASVARCGKVVVGIVDPMVCFLVKWVGMILRWCLLASLVDLLHLVIASPTLCPYGGQQVVWGGGYPPVSSPESPRSAFG